MTADVSRFPFIVVSNTGLLQCPGLTSMVVKSEVLSKMVFIQSQLENFCLKPHKNQTRFLCQQGDELLGQFPSIHFTVTPCKVFVIVVEWPLTNAFITMLLCMTLYDIFYVQL